MHGTQLLYLTTRSAAQQARARYDTLIAAHDHLLSSDSAEDLEFYFEMGARIASSLDLARLENEERAAGDLLLGWIAQWIEATPETQAHRPLLAELLTIARRNNVARQRLLELSMRLAA